MENLESDTRRTQPPRQTLSYLQTMFSQRRIRPKNKLGQNFLIDLNLIDLIVRAADLTRADLAIEVGSGTGGLTQRLIEKAGSVLSVEIDESFSQLVRDTVPQVDHLRMFHGDILKNKNHLNPHVLAALDELRERYKPERLKLTANLPYAVATPVISNFLLSDVPIERMVVTVQWEIAERMMAQPHSHEYSSLAVLVQSVADVELVRKLSPKVFWPQPKVDSAIVLIKPNAAKRAHVGDPGKFRVFLRELYSHRRKNLRGALAALPRMFRDKAAIDAELSRLGIDSNARAETLDIENHLRLCTVFG